MPVSLRGKFEGDVKGVQGLIPAEQWLQHHHGHCSSCIGAYLVALPPTPARVHPRRRPSHHPQLLKLGRRSLDVVVPIDSAKLLSR